MIEKSKDKYRIPSARANWWNYGYNSAYFVTICLLGRDYDFGEIRDGIMHLSKIGEITQTCWTEIPRHFPFVRLDKFVLMPNHIHGIVVIDKMNKMDTNKEQSINDGLSAEGVANKNEHMTSISPKPGTLSTIIRSYKSVVTKNARHIDANFSWQSRFYDHIIRNEQSYQTISEYIINNPANWEKDKFYI